MGNLYYYRNGSAMNLIWTTSLRVFPQHCNHHNGMIFGGEMLAQMDLAAAAAVARFLYDSPNGVSEALTVGVDKVTFHKGAKVGDLIIFTATITEVGQKRVTVKVVSNRETNAPKKEVDHWNKGLGDFVYKYESNIENVMMAEGIFHFCAYDMEKGKGTEHGMSLSAPDDDYNPGDAPLCDCKDVGVDEECPKCHGTGHDYSIEPPKNDTYSERASGYPEKSVKSYVAMKQEFEKRQSESKDRL